MKMFLQDKY